MQSGGATKTASTTKSSKSTPRNVSRKQQHKVRRRSSPIVVEEEETELFFNKRIPKDFRLAELPDDMVSFMNTYRKKERAELMKFLAESHKPLPSNIVNSVQPLVGPKITADHIYNACMPIKWHDTFMSSDKLIKLFFNQHSNSLDVTMNMDHIFKEDINREEGMETDEKYRNVEEVLDSLFTTTSNQPFYGMTMTDVATSVIDLIQETIATFAILKTPSFNMDNEFDRQLTLHYLNHYGQKYYTPILDVLNHIKVAVNEATTKMTQTYKKQNLNAENIDEHLKIIVVGNDRNFNKVTDKIMRFRNLVANKKKSALETKEGKYTSPIPYYACVKVDIIDDLVFTVNGNSDSSTNGLVYLNSRTGELVRSIRGIMNNKPDKLVLFYSKATRKSTDATNILITDKRSKLDEYYDISIELYIYKLLSEDKIVPKTVQHKSIIED
jgi:hypothetical protein